MSGRRGEIRNIQKMELEADEFSGYVVNRLGMREDTLDIFERFGDQNVSSPQHHGTPTEKLIAARRGWIKAALGKQYDEHYVPYLDRLRYEIGTAKGMLGLAATVTGIAAATWAIVIFGVRLVRQSRLRRLKIFVSYRRDDSAGVTGRIFDKLRLHVHQDHIFVDVDKIHAGSDFYRAVKAAIESCDVLLAVIGPDWIGAKDDTGERRLEDESDFVRMEISSGLEKGVRVIPVLVSGSAMPAPEELPRVLLPLAYLNAVELRHNRFDSDFQKLLGELTRKGVN
jgi:hypothetical protein